MEYVRAILMYQDSGFVVMIVSVATDVRTLVTKQHFFVRTGCEPFGEYTAGEAGAYNQIIKHLGLPSLFVSSREWPQRRLEFLPCRAVLPLILRVSFCR